MTSPHLQNILLTFKSQFLSLLGVPELPSGVFSSESTLSDWQLDALLRRRTLENVHDSTETLQSIVKLVDRIKNMPVKEDVRGDIQDALLASDMVGLSSII
jgi:phosphatidylinositol glycan class S